MTTQNGTFHTEELRKVEPLGDEVDFIFNGMPVGRIPVEKRMLVVLQAIRLLRPQLETLSTPVGQYLKKACEGRMPFPIAPPGFEATKESWIRLCRLSPLCTETELFLVPYERLFTLAWRKNHFGRTWAQIRYFSKEELAVKLGEDPQLMILILDSLKEVCQREKSKHLKAAAGLNAPEQKIQKLRWGIRA